MNNPKTSLIISTYNEPEVLEITLKSVLAQSVMPDEVIIADDGSKAPTQLLVDQYKGIFKIPFIHVWHEDNGFRLAEIRNKAIARASSDYIIQIDGDIIIHKHFIKDHLEFAKKGTFVRASRSYINEKTSDQILGVTIVAPRAGDMIAEFSLAMRWKLGLKKVLATVHAYPTWADANKMAALAWQKKNVPQKLVALSEKFHEWKRS